MSDCKPIVSRKFIKIGATEFDVLLGDGSTFDLRNVDTFYGEHIVVGTEISTVTLLNFLESWGAYNSTDSSVYIKSTETVLPNSDTGIGNIPLGNSLIVKYLLNGQTMMWLYADNGTVYRYHNWNWRIESLDSSEFVTTENIGTTVAGLVNGLLDVSVIPTTELEIVYGANLTALNALSTKNTKVMYIDESTRIKYYWTGSTLQPYALTLSYASQAEAEAGTVTNKVMAPNTTKAAINYHKSTANTQGSVTINSTTTNNTGNDNLVARKDHSHKIEGFALTDHVHSNGLVLRPSTGDVVTMDEGTVVDLNAATLGGTAKSGFATATQGSKADTAIQTITVGGLTRKIGTSAILPAYPTNSDFSFKGLNDIPSDFVDFPDKILVTNGAGGFVTKSFVSEDKHDYSKLLNRPTVSIDSFNPTPLTIQPTNIDNLKLHPIAVKGTVSSLSDVDISCAPEEGDVIQYKNGTWTNTSDSCCETYLSELTDVVLNDLSNRNVLLYNSSTQSWNNGVLPDTGTLYAAIFDNSGSGDVSGISYNGDSARKVSYNTIGAAPTYHSHTLDNISSISTSGLANNQILQYDSAIQKWINVNPPSASGITDLTFAITAGADPSALYNGTGQLTVDYHTVGAAPLSHNHTFSNISSVNINNPIDNQILKYDSATQKWINSIASSAGIAQLTFKVTGGANPTMVYDGSTPYAVDYHTVGAAPAVHNHSLSNLTDVLVEDIVDGQILQYDGNTSVWMPKTISSTTSVANLTFNTTGGAAPGTIYAGSTARTVDYHTVGAAPLSHPHGNVTNAGAIGSTAGLMVKTSVNGVLNTMAAGTNGQFLAHDATWQTPSDGTDLALATINPTNPVIKIGGDSPTIPNSNNSGTYLVAFDQTVISKNNTNVKFTPSINGFELKGGKIYEVKVNLTVGCRMNNTHGYTINLFEEFSTNDPINLSSVAIPIITGGAFSVIPAVEHCLLYSISLNTIVAPVNDGTVYKIYIGKHDSGYINIYPKMVTADVIAKAHGDGRANEFWITEIG